MVDPPDKDALRRLRHGVDALRRHDGRGPAHAEILELAAQVGADVGVTVDLDPGAGPPMVVLRPKDAPAVEFETLTRREREVAALVAKGLRNKEIAGVLGISLATVKDHVHRVLKKTGFGTRAEVAAAWHERG